MEIGFTTPYKQFDAAALRRATPYFQVQQYRTLFARGYTIDAQTITATGAQTDLQVQVWDRHADSDPSDGLAAVDMLQSKLTSKLTEAMFYRLAMIPYHLMFAKLKTMRPSVHLLTDV